MRPKSASRVRIPLSPPNKDAAFAAFLFGGERGCPNPPGSLKDSPVDCPWTHAQRACGPAQRDGRIAVRRDGHNPWAIGPAIGPTLTRGIVLILSNAFFDRRFVP